MYNWSGIKTLDSANNVEINGNLVNKIAPKHWVFSEGIPVDIMKCPMLNN